MPIPRARKQAERAARARAKLERIQADMAAGKMPPPAARRVGAPALRAMARVKPRETERDPVE